MKALSVLRYPSYGSSSTGQDNEKKLQSFHRNVFSLLTYSIKIGNIQPQLKEIILWLICCIFLSWSYWDWKKGKEENIDMYISWKLTFILTAISPVTFEDSLEWAPPSNKRATLCTGVVGTAFILEREYTTATRPVLCSCSRRTIG